MTEPSPEDSAAAAAAAAAAAPAAPAPDPPDGEVPDIGELLAVVEQLDEDNERLRLRVLELLELMEEAVTAQVAAERRADQIGERVRALEAELQAVADSRVVRLTAPLRRAYARARRSAGRGPRAPRGPLASREGGGDA